MSQKLAEVERQQRVQQDLTHTLTPVPASSLLPLDCQASSQANTQASHPRNQAREPSNTSINPRNILPEHQTNIHTDQDNKLTLNGDTVSRSKRPSKGPAPHPPVAVVDDLVNLDSDTSDAGGVLLREQSESSKACSKRNSLDNKSVQTLAKDLAAECAKAYELMESSLSKLTNDFSIGPFGLTPKSRKKSFARPAPPLK